MAWTRSSGLFVAPDDPDFHPYREEYVINRSARQILLAIPLQEDLAVNRIAYKRHRFGDFHPAFLGGST
jgi:hypothetical protein